MLLELLLPVAPLDVALPVVEEEVVFGLPPPLVLVLAVSAVGEFLLLPSSP